MNKQTLFTIAGVVFSLLIALCGWILTTALIDRKETALLAATGSTYLSSSPEATADVESGKDSASATVTEISKDTMVEILNIMNDPDNFIHLHEPVDGQIVMEQAITEAKEGLSYFCEHGIIPRELLEDGFTQTNAFLWENAPYEEAGKKDSSEKSAIVLPPEYSLWTITFNNNKIHVLLMLNAVTGKLWRVEITTYLPNTAFSSIDVSKMADIYSTYLGLDGVCSFSSGENWASKGFFEDMLHITAAKILSAGTTNKKITTYTDKNDFNKIVLFISNSGRYAEANKYIKVESKNN